jgi:hypothetical protein
METLKQAVGQGNGRIEILESHSANLDPSKPCKDPWTVEGPGRRDKPCDCLEPKPRTPRTTVSRPSPSPRPFDCCEQLVKLLQDRLGVSIPLHKPKDPTGLKVHNWCSELPTKDSTVPLIMLFLRRHLAGIPTANEFETDIRDWLASSSPERIEALRRGLEAYDNLDRETKDCLFETRFDRGHDPCLLDPTFIAKVLRSEILTLGIKHFYPRSEGVEGPGLVRLWEQPYASVTGLEFSNPEMTLGPWPWICSVDPGADNRDLYRNSDVFKPGTRSPVIFEEHEYEHDCKVVAGAIGEVEVQDCPRKSAVAKGAGGLGSPGFSSPCTGDLRYRHEGWCLAVPPVYPGEGIALRGFNFFSPNCTVRIRRLDGTFPEFVVPCSVYGDRVTDVTNDGKPAAACDVQDIVAFTLPYQIPQGPNLVQVPPGRYTLEVLVPNDIGFAPTPGITPAFFVSNTAHVSVNPPADAKFRIWTERAACYEPTPGWGSDEAWFKAFTFHLTLKPTGKAPVMKAFDVFNDDDVDRWVTIPISPAVDFLSNESLGKLGIFCAAVIGVEIDDEDAARDDVKEFGEAYLLYIKKWYTALSSSAAGSLAGKGIATLIEGGGATASLYAGGIALAVIAALGAVYAIWAPADPIGYDVFVFDNFRLSELTDERERTFSKTQDEIYGIGRYVIPLGKAFNPEHTQAVYTEEHQYLTDEKSQYGIRFQISRAPV